MAATFYPECMEIREGNWPNIERAGPHLATYAAVTPKEAAIDENMAPNRMYSMVLKEASEALTARRHNILEWGHLKRKEKRGMALTPPEMHRLYNLTKSADLNDSSIFQITIVQFVQQIIGQISSFNVINRAFTRIPADNLRGKIPEGGAPEVTVQVRRLTEPTITHTDFGQTEFRIRRNDMHLYFSREDRYEASIDPLPFSAAQGNKLLMQVRDLMALQTLSEAPEITTTTFPMDNNSIGSSQAMFVPRAAADSTGIFQEIVVNQWVKWRNEFKYIIMHPLDYRIHETNFYSRNKMTANPASANGITPFLGLERWGVTAIISPWVPRNRAYFVAGEGAYELDGPKVVDSDFDALRFADYFPVRDFVGYKLVHPERFTGKAVLNIENVTTADEITTDRQIQDMVKLPEDTVAKSDNP